ncbi:MAG: FG-GAP repeat domain-containing protein, partial [Solirubrobacterales bacterium]
PVTMTGEDQRAAFLHRDQDMLSGFPKSIRRGAITQSTPTGDGESSPVLADLDGDNRNELIVAGSDGFVHALRPNGSELPGWPVRGDRPPLHLGERAFTGGEVTSDVGGAVLGSVAVGDTNRDGIPEVFAADMEGKVYGWNADGTRFFQTESNPAFSGKPLQPFVNSRHGKTNRTQHGFIASPVLADLDGDGTQEIVAASMDRHLYAWHRNGNPVSGFPVLVVDPSKVASVDPLTDQVTFKANSGSQMQGAIVDTPAIADLNGDGKPEIVVGTNEEYDANQDGGWNASPANGASANLLQQAQAGLDAFKSACGPPCNPIPGVPISPANSRLYAIHPDGASHAGGAFLPGWPAKIAILNSELLPIVGEGVTGYPVIANASCGASSGNGPKIGAIANNGEGYVFNPDGKSCFGQTNGQDVPVQTDGYANQPDHPLFPAVGLPAFGNLGNGMAFLAPAAGLGRALDVGFPEYQQTGQDFIAAWTLGSGGQFQAGYPQTMNDLQFLTGPSIADINGNSGQELIEGSASKDLAAYTGSGQPASSAWPKVTTDWTVANPTIGSFGTLDTQSSAHKVVIAETRSGYVNAYSTGAGACTPSDWPRFHHDNANSGDFGRDAILPGKPMGASLTSGKQQSIQLTAPGDDLLCGTAASYQLVTSNKPINESNFNSATALAGAPAPAAPGTQQTFAIPSGAQRYLAIRAVDDQGNVGRAVSFDRSRGR